jgi:hypothetical protein
MTDHVQLREDLHAAPVGLAPPPALADTVLRRAARRRAATGLLAALLALVAIPVAGTFLAGGGGGTAGSAVSAAAGPSGGPMVVMAYAVSGSTGTPSYLLDPATGRYRAMPFQVVLSPDRGRVAVAGLDGRTGVAGRDALLSRGPAAVRWLSLPPANGLAWSPDGRALVVTAMTKAGRSATFTAYRYDVATGRVTATPVRSTPVGGVGWAADSRRYLVLEQNGDGQASVGALRFVGANGTPGAALADPGGAVGGADSYSPSRRLVVADTSRLMDPGTAASTVLPAAGGAPLARLAQGLHVVGWYDEDTVAALDMRSPQPVLRLVDAATGALVRSVDLSGLPHVTDLQLGPSDKVAHADRLGF